MKDKYINFNEKRMFIFSELVKRYWNGSLKNATDLAVLADEIKFKYGFNDSEMPFIKDHIRVAMGLDPKGDDNFSDELDVIKGIKEISQPMVAKLKGPCEHCSTDACECMEVGKYETQMYIRKNESVISNHMCLDCGYSAPDCDFGAVAEKIEFIPVIDLLKNETTPVFAVVAPAIVGQFGDNVSMGML